MGIGTGLSLRLGNVAASGGGPVNTGPYTLTYPLTGMGSSSFWGSGATGSGSGPGVNTTAAHCFNMLAAAAVTNPTFSQIWGDAGAKGTDINTEAVQHYANNTAPTSSPANATGQFGGHFRYEGDLIYQGYGNFTALTVAGLDDADAWQASFLAAFPSARSTFLFPKMDRNGPTALGAQIRARTRVPHPEKFIDYRAILMNSTLDPTTTFTGGGGSVTWTDAQWVAAGFPPPSRMQPGTVPQTHPDDIGYDQLFNLGMLPLIEANVGGKPFIAPWRQIYSTASTNQTNGGLVADMTVLHDLTGSAISTTSADFAFAILDAHTIRITRASGTAIKTDYTDVPITVAKSGYAPRTSYLRISLGTPIRNDKHAPALVKMNAAIFAAVDAPAAVTTKKFTLVFAARVTDAALDSLSTTIFSVAGTHGTLTRSANGSLSLSLKQAGTTTTAAAFNSQGGAIFTSAATAVKWIFIEVDMSQATGAAGVKMYVDETPATLTVATFVSGSNLSMSDGIYTLLAASTDLTSSGCRPWSNTANEGQVAFLGIYPDLLGVTDATVGAARRALFRDPAAPNVPLFPQAGGVDLAVNNGTANIAPHVYLTGNAGDLFNRADIEASGTGGGCMSFCETGRMTTA